MPGFKASKDKLTLWLGANEVETNAHSHSENPSTLRNYPKFTLPVLYKGNNKA